MNEAAEHWKRVAAAFDALVDLDAETRARRLDALEDPALAAEVRALLAADAGGSAVLDAGVAGAVPDLLDGAPPDRRAGPYRLLHPIGEGGMGVVWLGERTDGAYEQQAAVKIIKRGMDSAAIVRRFVQERRILARLRHAYIVRLLDGGMTADGRPFYVMEHVHGSPVTVHAAERRLDVAARIALLAKVADAVAYAHAHLVVHRDLKPSNVLVDADGEPRVLDFGIAKLIEDTGEQTVTGTGARVLSPAYAAPEQILGEPVGTTADVYALGLLMSELLTGALPQQRRAASAAQLAHEAAHETSQRLSLMAVRQSRDRLAALYGDAADGRRLARRLGGDLDVIAATALQREPARRYPTAAAFAEDLRRWLDGRPIAARADSAAYRLGRYARRHRLGVAAATLIALSLLAGLGAALWQARIAREQARQAATERQHAERQLARTERVKDFMLTLFREHDPISRAKAQARTAPELIREGVAQIDATLAAEPELQAELLRDLGQLQVGLDDRAGGEATLRRAWALQTTLSGPHSAAAAEALAAHAGAVYATGDSARAGTMLREAVAQLRQSRGADHASTVEAEARLAVIEMIEGRSEEAERLARHALEVARARYGDGHAELIEPLGVLGNIVQERGRYPEALSLFDEALRIVAATHGEDHARGVTLHSRRGDALRVQRRYDEALVDYETALRIERAQLPAGHVLIGGTLLRLGDLQRRTGRFEAADRSLSEAIAILGGTPSGQYAQALQFHANLALAQGDLDLAVRRYRASIEAFRSAGGDSVYAWLTRFKLADVLIAAGRVADAEPEVAEAAAAAARTRARSGGSDPYGEMYAATVTGSLRHAQGRYEEAVALRRQGLASLLRTYGEAHAEVAAARVALAASLVATRDPGVRDEAAALFEAARAILEAAEPGAGETDGTFLGSLYLERARLRRDSGDLAGAREDAQRAVGRLTAPDQTLALREARRLAAALGPEAATAVTRR
ncbi:MAG TPA: serine/threonine-protein kinase [Dokdonella sp.]|uniref:serine/threonine-protein kinase n=1 Tax=Dokdonella sp. TaxID=2291710 RepID=UPI002CA2C25C|nr:serine/threonine-protein kinase [Dokdonella sp.]HUD43704.1 serine/threonine-protein kinase [Dokdonella sp.]